jgi:hypothetical protein
MSNQAVVYNVTAAATTINEQIMIFIEITTLLHLAASCCRAAPGAKSISISKP